MIATRQRAYQLVDGICEETKRARNAYTAAAAVTLTAAAATAPAGTVHLAALVAATVLSSAAGVGWVSRWRGWGR